MLDIFLLVPGALVLLLVVEAGSDPGDFDECPLPLNTLSSRSSILAHHHRSYPILHQAEARRWSTDDR